MTRRAQARRVVALAAIALLLQSSVLESVRAAAAPLPASKVKLRGYITARIDERTMAILDDQIHCEEHMRLVAHSDAGDQPFTLADLAPGLLIEAEGVWTARHRFEAEKIVVDAEQLSKQIRESAYLQEEPADAQRISGGEPAELKADGEWLMLDARAKRDWSPRPSAVAASDPAGAAVPGKLAGYQVRYAGVRRADGRIAAERVELGPPAPRDAYKLPHGIEVVRGQDPQTKIDVLEFRRGSKVDGRMKLFPVREVQEYVSHLGGSLIPAGARGTTRALEFRFFVVEDPSLNAAALPDGTVLVNTGLLGAVENEAQLAFVLSHEIAHTLQAHYWREVHETRPKRIGLLFASLAGGFFIGDLGIFLAELGMAAVVNGHQRQLENQADRLGLQNLIEHGYDPRPAPGFMRTIVERYGNRSTSKLWSNHDSSVLRGSFLTVQLMRQYPEGRFENARVDTEAFRAMREAMGPVRIQ